MKKICVTTIGLCLLTTFLLIVLKGKSTPHLHDEGVGNNLPARDDDNARISPPNKVTARNDRSGTLDVAHVSPKHDEILWPEYQPLSKNELEEFSLAEKEIERYFQWGSVAPESIDKFRAIIFNLGDRGVAHYARELASITENDITDHDSAASVINHIDMISYFAAVNRPIAIDAVRTLALRNVEWTPTGEIIDGLQATVTFEAFDVLAKIDPDFAANHLKKGAEEHQDAYIMHYIYGRRLAKISENEIKKEVFTKIGPKFVNNKNEI